MSMAPANRASMAAGPALKLVHCTLTWGLMALSKNPFALPTMACAWVMLGNAPTRIVFALPCPHAAIEVMRKAKTQTAERLITLGSSNHHGEDAGRLIFLLLLLPLATLTGARV